MTTRGSSGHVLPLAPFGHAALRAGHEVLVAAQRQHQANVERAGLPFAPVGDPPAEEWMPLMAEFSQLPLETANARMIGEFFARIDTRAALPALRAIVERWRPDLIVRESWEYASTLVADAYGIPIARVGLGLASVEELAVRLAAPSVDRERADMGLPADPAGERLRAAPYLTTVPQELEDPSAPTPRRLHRFRPAAPGANGAALLLDDWWPGNDDPLVYLTFGSVAAGAHLPYFPALYRAAIDALAPLPVRLLVTIGNDRDAAELDALPANVHVERWVAQDAIAPTRPRSWPTAVTARRSERSRRACRSWSCRSSAATSGSTRRPSPASAPASPWTASARHGPSSVSRAPASWPGCPTRSCAYSGTTATGAGPEPSPAPSRRCRRSTPRSLPLEALRTPAGRNVA